MKLEAYEGYSEQTAQGLSAIHNYFLTRNLPMCFNPYDDRSVLIHGEKEFEDICNAMEDSGAQGVRDSTVFEFYSKVRYLENKAQKMKQHAR